MGAASCLRNRSVSAASQEVIDAAFFKVVSRSSFNFVLFELPGTSFAGFRINKYIIIQVNSTYISSQILKPLGALKYTRSDHSFEIKNSKKVSK